MNIVEIIGYGSAAGALSGLVVTVLVRLYCKPALRSRSDAQRRIGIDGAETSIGPGPQFARGGKGGVGPNGKGGAGGVARNTGPIVSPAKRVVGKHPGLSAPYGRTPSPTPAPDPYFDNPVLNPIHPLHSAFVPSPSYDPPSPTPSPSYDCPTPSPSYDCPTPSPSYDSGSSSSCDSPSPSPSSWD